MIWIVAALIGVLGAPGDVDPFDAFFAEYAAKRDGIEVLEARFVQKQVMPDDLVKTTGSLLYVRPRRVVLRTDDPASTTLVDGQRVYEYEDAIEQMLVYDLGENSSADLYFMFFDSDAESLRRDHDVQLLEREDARGKRGMLIRPKPREDKPPDFVEASVYLRDADLLPYEIHIVLDADSQVFFTVTKMEVNGAPPPEASQITLPPGTKIIENDVVRGTVGPEGRRVPEAARIRTVKPPETRPELKIEEIPAP